MQTTPVSGHIVRPRVRREARAMTRTPRAQVAWLAAGLAFAFSIPFFLTDAMPIDRDVYYGVYIAAVFGFVALWLRYGTASPRALMTRNWRRGVLLGTAFVAAMVAIVLKEPATPHPHGLGFAAAIVWRGVLYGLADGVILSAFPILAVLAAFGGWESLSSRRGKLGVGVLALCVSLLFTAVYHVGYSDFRGGKVRKPLAGDVVWSLPTLMTLSPIASPITHAGLHVAAVVHSYDTDTFLPPHGTPAFSSRPDLQVVLDSLVLSSDAIAPGATAYVSGPDGAWLGSAGVANVASGAPMRADARMRLESVSKIWTGVIVHQLAQEGKLRVSDTVEHWLPGILPYGRKITIAELLVHRSGLIDNNDVARDPAPYFARVTDPAFKAELLAVAARLSKDPTIEFSPRLWIRLASYQPLLAPPGTLYHYSNIGFELLGLIAARAGGESIGALYRDRIFEPLGLRDTAYDPQGPIAGQHAQGYRVATGRRFTDETAAHAGIGAEGGIVSDAKDTATMLVALMHGKLLGARELARMKSGQFWSGGDPTGCGGVAFGHSGGGAGFKTNVWVSGDGERVAVLLLNGRGGPAADGRAGAAMAQLYCSAASPTS